MKVKMSGDDAESSHFHIQFLSSSTISVLLFHPFGATFGFFSFLIGTERYIISIPASSFSFRRSTVDGERKSA